MRQREETASERDKVKIDQVGVRTASEGKKWGEKE